MEIRDPRLLAALVPLGSAFPEGYRSEVRTFHFPSCADCDLRETCDLRAKNHACWGYNPSCADCLWAQDIVRCP